MGAGTPLTKRGRGEDNETCPVQRDCVMLIPCGSGFGAGVTVICVPPDNVCPRTHIPSDICSPNNYHRLGVSPCENVGDTQ